MSFVRNIFSCFVITSARHANRQSQSPPFNYLFFRSACRLPPAEQKEAKYKFRRTSDVVSPYHNKAREPASTSRLSPLSACFRHTQNGHHFYQHVVPVRCVHGVRLGTGPITRGWQAPEKWWLWLHHCINYCVVSILDCLNFLRSRGALVSLFQAPYCTYISY